jgi:hypothetical protein
LLLLLRLAGQEVVVVAVGPEAYTSWEGYVEEDSGRAVIGLSYDKLCRDVRPGGRILLADGSITIKVGRAAGCCCCCWYMYSCGCCCCAASSWLNDGSITTML